VAGTWAERVVVDARNLHEIPDKVNFVAAPSLGIAALRPRGSCRSHHTFGPCLKLMADGKIDTETLVDLAVPIENFREALRTLKADKANTFKVVFELGL
jgi:threonine dehydrogenase-like Zn-dependent dehydrogenase